jgi:hypothetical protein
MTASVFSSLESLLSTDLGGPRRQRQVTEDLAELLLQPQSHGGRTIDDRRVLSRVTDIIDQGPTGERAQVVIDALAIVGHRLGAGRNDHIEQILIDCLERILAAHSSTGSSAPAMNALAELSATRPVPAAVRLALLVLDLARNESEPSLVAVDGALVTLRAALGPRWRDTLRERWAGLPRSPNIEDAVELATEQEQ